MHALQQGKNDAELGIQKAQRIVTISALGQQKAVYSLVRPRLVVMQEACKVGQIIFTNSGDNIIVDVPRLGRRRVKTEDAPCRMVITPL